MSRATPQLRDFAARLIAYETKKNKFFITKIPAAFSICNKLHRPLAVLMGNMGVHSLLTRALTLTHREVDTLRALQVEADGTLSWLENKALHNNSTELAKASVILISQLLGLLVAFIGEILTLQLVHELWPKLPLNNSDFGLGNDNENAK